jgi:hypothetical protein
MFTLRTSAVQASATRRRTRPRATMTGTEATGRMRSKAGNDNLLERIEAFSFLKYCESDVLLVIV